MHCRREGGRSAVSSEGGTCNRIGRNDPLCEGVAVEHPPIGHTPNERLCRYHYERVLHFLRYEAEDELRAEREHKQFRRMWGRSRR